MWIKGIRKEWENKHFFIVVNCNDGKWAINATDDINEAWEIIGKYPNSYFMLND